MRPALSTFVVEFEDGTPGPLVTAGEMFAADHPFVALHPHEFGVDEPEPDYGTDEGAPKKRAR